MILLRIVTYISQTVLKEKHFVSLSKGFFYIKVTIPNENVLYSKGNWNNICYWETLTADSRNVNHHRPCVRINQTTNV